MLNLKVGSYLKSIIQCYDTNTPGYFATVWKQKKNLNDENTMHYFVTTENENSFKTLTNTLAYFAKVPVGETKKVLKR